MKNIMIKPVKKEYLFCSAMLLTCIAALLCGFFMPNENFEIFENASYEIAKCTDSQGKRINICSKKFSDSFTVNAEKDTEHYKNAKLIVKLKNAEISAFSKGKVIYKSSGKKREYFLPYYALIDADSTESSEIQLRFTPINENAKILSDIYITTQNDFILSFLKQNAKKFFVVLSVFTIFLFSAVYNTVKLRKGRKIKNFFIPLMLSEIFLLNIMFAQYGFYQFFGISPSIAYFLYGFSYCMIPVSFSHFFTDIYKIKSRAVTALQFAVSVYGAVRALLYIFFAVPFEAALIINHIIVLSCVGVSLIYAVSKFKKFLNKKAYEKSLGCIKLDE